MNQGSSAQPCFSVCLCTYNGLPYLQEQLASLDAQLGPDDEIIVIDDASMDGTAAWLRDFTPVSGCTWRLECRQENSGPATCFAAVATMASKDIVLFCDQDDVWLPGRVARLRAAFGDDPALFLYHGNAQLVDAALRPLPAAGSTWLELRPELYRRKGQYALLSCLVRRSQAVACMMAFRRTGLDSSFYRCMAQAPMHDLFLVCAAALSGRRCLFDRQVTMLYRRHAGTATASGNAGQLSWKALAWRLQLAASLLLWVSSQSYRRPLAMLNGLFTGIRQHTDVLN